MAFSLWGFRVTRERDSAGRSRRQFLKTAAATGVVAGFSAVSFAQDQQTDEPPLLKFGGLIPGWQGYAPEPISGSTNPTLNLQQNQVYTVLWKNVDGAPHNFALLDEEGNTLPVIQTLVPESTEIAINETNATEFNVTNMTGANMTGNQTNVTGNQTTTPNQPTTPNQTQGNATGNQTQVTELEGNLVQRTPTISQEGAVQVLRFETTENVAQYQCTIHPTTMVGDVQFGGDVIGGGGNQTGNQTGGNQSGGNGNGGY